MAELSKADIPEEWMDVVNDANKKATPIDEGRRSNVFYLCGGCNEPYFGGTMDCADEDDWNLLRPRIDSVSRSSQSLKWYANTHICTDFFISGNADTAATHRGMFVMTMSTFVAAVMT